MESVARKMKTNNIKKKKLKTVNAKKNFEYWESDKSKREHNECRLFSKLM